MPPRHALPGDDLYARLEVPFDATPEAIEVAWRALLKRHHPDIAGAEALELAKRINVAHDWLSNAELRARYDRERHPNLRRSPRAAGWSPRRAAETAATATTADEAHHPRPRPPWPRNPEEALSRYLERVRRLTRDELDRLSMAEPPPIAFVASIRRFLGPDRSAALERAEREVERAAPAEAWRVNAVRDALLSAAHEIVLAPFLDEHLSEAYLDRARERLTRAWEAAIDQPRYGPNTPGVERLVARAAGLAREELRVLARAAPDAIDEEPWPPGIDPAEDEVFRVSSALARRDVAAAAPTAGVDRATLGRARRSLRAAAHAMVLRHAFPAEDFRALLRPWLEATGDPGTGRGSATMPRPVVRRA